MVIRRVEIHYRALSPYSAEELVHCKAGASVSKSPEMGMGQFILPSQYVLFPEPGLPSSSCAKGIFQCPLLYSRSRAVQEKLKKDIVAVRIIRRIPSFFDVTKFRPGAQGKLPHHDFGEIGGEQRQKRSCEELSYQGPCYLFIFKWGPLKDYRLSILWTN